MIKSLLKKNKIAQRIKAVKDLFLEKLDNLILKSDQQISQSSSLLEENTKIHHNTNILLEKTREAQSTSNHLIENGVLLLKSSVDTVKGIKKLIELSQHQNILTQDYFTNLQQELHHQKDTIIRYEEYFKNLTSILKETNYNLSELKQQGDQNRRLVEISQDIKIQDVIIFSMDENYLENKKRIQANDIFLASYPRSGNTWIRLLMSDLILQTQGYETSTGGNIIPDIYKDNINIWFSDSRINNLPFRIVKTHETYETEYEKIIYVVRNPADAICSYYHYTKEYCTKENSDDNECINDIDDFCLSHLSQWYWHTQTYIKLKERKAKKIQFVSYESLKNNTVKSLQSIATFCGLQVEQELCQKAVDNQEFKKLQDMAKQTSEIKLGFKEDNGYDKFFRQGEVNTSSQELSTETMRLIEEKTMDLYAKAKSFESLDLS